MACGKEIEYDLTASKGLAHFNGDACVNGPWVFVGFSSESNARLPSRVNAGEGGGKKNSRLSRVTIYPVVGEPSNFPQIPGIPRVR
jgi:hypothetical protein